MRKRVVRIAVLAAFTGSLMVAGAPAKGANEAIWGKLLTADLPSGFWAEGEYNSFYALDGSWTYPPPGDTFTTGGNPIFPFGGPYTVSAQAPLHPGHVVIGASDVLALNSFPPGPEGPQCTGITTFHPDQPTRLAPGWAVDDPRTSEVELVTKKFAMKHFKTLSFDATPAGGSPVQVVQQELFDSTDQGPSAARERCEANLG